MSARSRLIDKLGADLVNKDWSRAEAAFTPAVRTRLAAGAEIETFPSLQWRLERLFAAFPDADANVASVVRSGAHHLVLQGTFTGTHRGPLATGGALIPPTQRRVNLRFSCFCDFADGRIDAQSIYFDRLDLLEQLGVVGGASC